MTWEIALMCALTGVTLVLLGATLGRSRWSSPPAASVEQAPAGPPKGVPPSLLGELEEKVLSCERRVRSMQDQMSDWFEKANRLDKRLYMRERRARAREEEATEEGEEQGELVLPSPPQNGPRAAGAPDWFEAELRA